MDLSEIYHKGESWMELAQDRVRCQALVLAMLSRLPLYRMCQWVSE
jgi:hypothetical protein